MVRLTPFRVLRLVVLSATCREGCEFGRTLPVGTGGAGVVGREFGKRWAWDFDFTICVSKSISSVRIQTRQ